MFELIGVPPQALFGQLLLGLINGAFYALLSLGLAVIFGMLNVINFTHGAQYMMGAFGAWILLNGFSAPWPHFINVGDLQHLAAVGNTWQHLITVADSWMFGVTWHQISLGIPYWGALIVVPLIIGLFGAALERLLLSRLYHLDHLYGLLLTFGLALILEGLFRRQYGSSGLPYSNPIPGGTNLGFMFLPSYRGWIVVFSLFVCLATWFVIEKTKLGSYLRAATENPTLVRAFGINVPLMMTATYGFGVGLAALAGVLAAPIYSVNPIMGSNLIIVVFAVVVIGGMGSIMGSIVTGFGLGVIEGLTKVFYPEASNTVIFIIMAIVLMIRPAGLFGTQR